MMGAPEGPSSMLNQPEPACLVIADISGYTGFLAGAELDHAQDILADLMNTVVSAFRPGFRLAKLEGDAAFVYVIAPTVDATQLQDTLERCYFAFRRRLRDIRQASTCECNACMLIPNLNLKILAHHGVVARHRIAGWEELVGREGTVRTPLDPTGQIFIQGALWRARLSDPAAAAPTVGDRVSVDSVDGLTLAVSSVGAPSDKEESPAWQ